MAKRIFFIFLFISFNYLLFAQDKEFAFRIISDLASPKYHGRGYTHNGNKKAAKYIINTLKNIQVSQIQVQKFEMPVSVIKDVHTLKFDSVSAVLGYEVMIYPGSCSIDGTFPIIKVTSNNLSTLFMRNQENSFIMLDTSIIDNPKFSSDVQLLIQKNLNHVKGFIMITGKQIMQTQQAETSPWVTMETTTKFLDAKNISLKIKSKHFPKFKTQNIIAMIPGQTDTVIAFSAHYDHLGEMGKHCYFPGANDNASGDAMVLDLARELSTTKPHYTYAFLFFTGEEIGLVGSFYFVNNPIFPLSKIKELFNLDVVGSGEDGIAIVNGTVFPDISSKLDSINNKLKLVPSIQKRGKAFNSDHAPFSEKGVKAVFIYAKGKTGPYHHPDDVPSQLSMGKYNEIVKLLLNVIK
jgi:hypothetical protein